MVLQLQKCPRDLNELVNNKTASLAIKAIEIKNELATMNSDIVSAEQMLTTEYKTTLNGRLTKREEDLKRHNSNEPKEVKKPNKKPTEVYTERLRELESEIKDHEKKIKDISFDLTKINTKIGYLEDIKERMLILTDSIDRFNLDLVEIATKFKFDSEKFKVVYGTPLTEIETKLRTLTHSRDTKQVLVDMSEQADEKTSLYKTLQKLMNAKKELISKTDSQEKEYQKYLDDIREWRENSQGITGDNETPETIEYLKNEVTFLNKLPNQYEELKQQRMEMIKQLFELKRNKAQIYESIYKPVENQLVSLLTDMEDEIQFAVNISMSDKEAPTKLLDFIDKSYSGLFHSKVGSQKKMNEIVRSCDFNCCEDVCTFISEVLDSVYENLDVSEQKVKDKEGFYTLLTSLDYLDVEYDLRMNEKCLDELSAGERGSVLLMFYLALSKKENPIIIDQPEDNLDNQSVFDKLVPYILKAKKKRQIIIVTHNPNIAVACDAEEIIYCSIDKQSNRISYESGSIENEVIRDKVIKVLEGTMPAFTLRRLKYTLETSHDNERMKRK